jgi:hypothetical protein
LKSLRLEGHESIESISNIEHHVHFGKRQSYLIVKRFKELHNVSFDCIDKFRISH